MYTKIFKDIVAQNIKRNGIDRLMEFLEHSDFYTAPASTKYHDSFEGGLCYHSIQVYEHLKAHYIGTNYSLETISIVALFHDICKTGFYTVTTRNVKDDKTGKWHQEPYYTVDDKFPFGHSEKSVYLINECMRLTVEEAMAINAHMGGFDSRTDIISKTFAESNLAVELHIADLRATYQQTA